MLVVRLNAPEFTISRPVLGRLAECSYKHYAIVEQATRLWEFFAN